MRGRAFPLAVLILALAAPAAAAQYSDDPGQQYGRHGGRMHGMARGSPPDPVILQGPPAPADFQKLVQLPDAKLPGYQKLVRPAHGRDQAAARQPGRAPEQHG